MIESAQNKYYKEIMSLKQKKFVDKLNRFVIEGEKFVLDIDVNVNIIYYVIGEEYANSHNCDDLVNRSNVFIMKESLFHTLTNTVNSQGIMAICQKNNLKMEDIKSNYSFIVICENIQDPGNLGTIIRTAECAGADAIITTKGSVSIYNQKVIRSTAGAIFNIPIIENVLIDHIISVLKENNIEILGTHLEAEKFYFEANLLNKIAIVIGNEGNGMSDKFTVECNQLIKIPILGKSESLNAAIASSIVIYDVVRQRKLLGGNYGKSNSNNEN